LGVLVALATVTLPAASEVRAEGNSFKCQEQPLEFKLRETSHPTNEQIEQRCHCVWDKLGTWERQVAIAIFNGEDPTGPWPTATLNVHAFMSRLVEAMRACGAYDL